jgi:hypothetical protein
MAERLHGAGAHAIILRTNSGSSRRWLRMIPSLGTGAATDTLRGRGVRLGGKGRTNNGLNWAT